MFGVCKKRIGAKRNLPHFFPYIGRIAYWMDGNYEKADALFDKLIALNPSDIQLNNLKLKSQLFKNLSPDVAT